MVRLSPALAAVVLSVVPGCDCRGEPDPGPPTGSHAGDEEAGDAAPSGPYRSSYLVFVSSDPARPLVVPVDVNWRAAGDERVAVELKAWIGEPAGWTMRYAKERFPQGGGVPERWWEVPTADGFEIGLDGATLSVDVEGRRVELSVPPFGREGLVRERFAGGTISTRADRTELTLGDERREGYLLQERVEMPAEAFSGDERPFDRFQYFVLVGCDGLYLLKDEGGGERHAARFRPGGWPAVAELATFHFAETRREHDAERRRDDIPTAWRVTLPEWGKSFSFRSTAHHTGHGPADARPRPVYRQASVVGSAEGERCDLHGMAELVLEDEGAPPRLDAQPEVPAVLSVAALPAIRTSGRPPFVRLRVDNRTAGHDRIRIRAASRLAAPPRQVELSRLSVTRAELGAVYSEAERAEAPIDEWIDVPPNEARLLDVGLRDSDARHSPFTARRYELVVERDEGPPIHVEASLGDGIRHPVRR